MSRGFEARLGAAPLLDPNAPNKGCESVLLATNAPIWGRIAVIHRAVIASGRERLATDSLAFAIVGLVLWPFGLLLCPVAIARGLAARRRIEASNGQLSGARVALWGICLGVLGTCFAYAALGAEVMSFVLTGNAIPAY